jgi:hypothetical protein
MISGGEYKLQSSTLKNNPYHSKGQIMTSKSTCHAMACHLPAQDKPITDLADFFSSGNPCMNVALHSLNGNKKG